MLFSECQILSEWTRGFTLVLEFCIHFVTCWHLCIPSKGLSEHLHWVADRGWLSLLCLANVTPVRDLQSCLTHDNSIKCFATISPFLQPLELMMRTKYKCICIVCMYGFLFTDMYPEYIITTICIFFRYFTSEIYIPYQTVTAENGLKFLWNGTRKICIPYPWWTLYKLQLHLNHICYI